MLKVFIFLLAVSGGFPLKCYVCKNTDDPLCFELENSNGKFLQECKPGENECAVLQERSTDPYITRMCVAPTWRCDDAKFKCGKCTTDGCNSENEVKTSKTTKFMPPTNEIGDLLKANSTGIGLISLVVVLAVIFCVIRCCSRRKKVAFEDDCDEYYENETNIDLE